MEKKRLGSTKNLGNKDLIAPFIKDFQDPAIFNTGEEIRVDAKKGWLLILEK